MSKQRWPLVASLLNLRTLLRHDQTQTDDPRKRVSFGDMSRRSFLKLSGSVPLLPHAGAALGRFDLQHEGGVARFLVDGIERWRIDPAEFAASPKLRVARRLTSFHLALTGARFPGTTLSAALRCFCRSTAAGWLMDLEFTDLRWNAHAPLIPWLLDSFRAESAIRFPDVRTFACGSRFGVNGTAHAVFSPSWTFEIAGRAWLGGQVGSCSASSLTIAIPPRNGESLLASATPRTRVTMEKGTEAWQPASPPVPNGATLSGFEEAVDLLDAEFAETQSDTFSAVRWSARHEHPTLLPRQQVQVALSNATHVIVAKQGNVEERLFAADLAGPTTIPTTAFQLRLVNDSEERTITVHEVNGERRSEKVAPVVHSVIASIEGASSFAVAPPERVTLDLTDGYADAHGCWGLADCSGGTDVEVCAPSICFGVLRPEDLLMLCVELRNVRVRKPFLGTPYIEACGANPSLILHFPPQHVGEQAFFEALCPAQSEDPCDPPVAALIAGWSRLAFTLPGTGRTPFTLQALLDWSELTPSLVDQTRPRHEIARPPGDKTDLELPYRVHLSPETEERWRHSAQPRVDGERTELWHTRLVRPPLAEGDSRPRVRAVWSPDFISKDGCEPLPGDCPFRMSLAPLDRHRLVRVMHDRGIDAAPAAANLLLLSSLGAWTDIEGFWPRTREHPNRPVPLEKWQHVMTMGRDQKVVVETRGFLLPFGHPATLVKETERKIQILHSREGGRLPVPVAYLRQRKYIRIKHPVMPCSNWDMAFRTVTFLEKVSPPIDDPLNAGIPRPNQPNPNAHWSEKAFWPKVAGRPYEFLLEGFDYAGARLRFHAPVIFVEAPGDDRPGEGCEQPKCEKYDGPCVGKPDEFVPASPFEDPVADAVRHYNSEGAKPLRRILLDGQPLSIAASRRKGDTEIEATVVEFHACAVEHSPKPGTEPCTACARETDFPPGIFPPPPFFASSPKVKGAVPSLERILPGNGGDAWWIVQNPNCFADGTEVFAALSLVLGEVQFRSDIDTRAKADDFLAQDQRLQDAGAAVAGIVFEQGRFFWRQDVSALDAAFTRSENDATYRYFHESESRPPAAPFQNSADKSGGALAPTPSITHLSREVGPIGLSPGARHPAATAITSTFDLAINAAASKPFNPADFFSADATILGKVRIIDILQGVLGVGDVPAVLSTLLDFADGPNELTQTIDWKTRALKRLSLGGFFEFIPLPEAELEIHGSFFAYVPPVVPPTFSMGGEVRNVSIAINVGVGGVGVEFNRVSYRAGSDGSSQFDVDLGDIRFTGALAVVQQLAETLKSFQKGSVAGLEYELKPDGLLVRTPPLELPTIPLGAFTLANLSIGSWLKLPFRAQPVEIGAFFSRPEAPFQVTVGIFGGQGYFMVAIDADQKGIRYLAASVEFGALKELSFGPAHGKVYVLGGVYYGITVSGNQKITVFRAFVRAGGEVDVLGLISMCIDVYVGLEARDDGVQSSLIGEATLTVSFKIGFFEKSATLRRTERFAGSQTGGGGGQTRLDLLPPPMISAAGSAPAIRANKRPDLEAWMPKWQFKTYWNAFARASTGGRE